MVVLNLRACAQFDLGMLLCVVQHRAGLYEMTALVVTNGHIWRQGLMSAGRGRDSGLVGNLDLELCVPEQVA